MMKTLSEWKSVGRGELEGLFRLTTASAIAATYGVTEGAVRHKLRVLGLSARVSGIKHSPGPKNSFKPPKGEMEALYETMTMRDLAVHYGVGETVIWTRLRDYGISSKTRSERLTGKPKSQAHKDAVSRAKRGAMAGDKSPHWRGGLTGALRKARTNREYRDWKADVLRLGDYKCVDCGLEHGHVCGCCGHIVLLHAHHINEFSEFPNLRYEATNGKALCERCHQVEHYK